MAIHLSKHWLGETEKSLVEMTGRDGGPMQLEAAVQRDADEFTRRIAEMANRRTSEHLRQPDGQPVLPAPPTG